MKKANRLVALVVLVLLTTTMFAACSDAGTSGEPAGEAPQKEVYIGKIPITLSHAVHGNDAKWAEIYAEEKYGAKYEVIDPDGDLAAANKAVEDFIAKGVDGIILHPPVESGVNEAIQEARDAGVYVVTYFMDATEAEVPYVRVDEVAPAKKMGREMAKQWTELYPDKPVQVGFVDFLSISYCMDFRSGPFMEGVKEIVPDIEGQVTGIKNSKGEEILGATFWLGAEGDLSAAQAIGQDVLQAYPDVNIIYGTNTPNVLGTLSAYEAVGRGKAKDGVPLTEIFAGTDGDAPELLKLADPTSSLKYTMGMQPQTFAYAQVDTMMSVINGEIAADGHSEVAVEDKYMSYYETSIDEMQDWFNTQYFGEIDIAAELAK